MIRRLVRNLIGPLVRWASRNAEMVILFTRCPEHGVRQVILLDGFGKLTVELTPDECRKWAATLYRLARDQQESIPADECEADDDASDLRW